MSSSINEVLNNSQLSKTRSVEPKPPHVPAYLADELSLELCAEYGNYEYRKWYLKVIYTYGISQIVDWKKRASDGKCPGKLFSTYIKEAKNYPLNKSLSDER